MSYHVTYKLDRPAVTLIRNKEPMLDKMAPIRTMNRIARVACQKFMLLMNNTLLIKQRRLENMADLMVYLRGNHDDLGMSGDRGDFYRRKLAEQIYLNFAVEGVTHQNVTVIIETAMRLEQRTLQIMTSRAAVSGVVPALDVDESVLDILARIADVF